MKNSDKMSADTEKRLDRLKPFTELYQPWDKPTFDPSKHYLQPAKPSETNRSFVGRLYESVLSGFGEVRTMMLQHQAGPPPRPTETSGSNG